MRVLVCGGRNFRSPAQVAKALEELHSVHKFTHLIHGGYRGVDTYASDWAKTKPEITRYVSYADWDTYGAAAGPIRNSHMLTWGPDLVIAFEGGDGTADMVNKARAAGIKVLEIK